MSSAPTTHHYPGRNSLRRQSKNQRNPWKASSASCAGQDVSGYSGNSDTLSSGSRKYRASTRKITSSTVGPSQREIICHQPEPAYENVAMGGRMTLSRYVTSSSTSSQQHQQVPYQHHQHSVRRSQPGTTTTLYTLSHGNNHHPSHAPLIDPSRPSTSPEAQNIYDVIEEKSSGRRTGTSRGTLPHRPMTPGSVKTVASETGVYACGGHCLTFERVCDKVLRVVYGIGVLVGIGLLLAGMNGHQLRVHQNTLMYIGLMVFSVCCFLLWIQCRHYSNRRRRRTILVRRPPVHHQTMIPLQDFNGGITSTGVGVMNNHMAGGLGVPGVNVLMHENPLLHRYIEQQHRQCSYSPSEIETHASSLYVQA